MHSSNKLAETLTSKRHGSYKINIDELAHYSPRGCEDANEKQPIWHNELHLRKKRLAHSF